MGFSSYSNLVSGSLLRGNTVTFPFVKQATGQTNVWASIWTGTGMPPAGATPAVAPGGTVYVNDSGSLSFLSQSSDKFLTRFGVYSSNTNIAGSIMLHDRLVAVSGLVLSATGDTVISSSVLPRYGQGDNVEAWLEVTTQTATTAPVVRMSSYTNQDGVTGRMGDAVTFPAAATLARAMVKLPLGDGDRGIRSIETMTVDVSGTAGVANIVLLKPLIFLGISEGSYNETDQVLQKCILPRVLNGASLSFMFILGAGANQIWPGFIEIAY